MKEIIKLVEYLAPTGIKPCAADHAAWVISLYRHEYFTAIKDLDSRWVITNKYDPRVK